MNINCILIIKYILDIAFYENKYKINKSFKKCKKAKRVYKQLLKAMKKACNIEELAFQFDLQDYENSLKNARDSKDRNTIHRLMKERNEFIKRHRSESRDFEH